MSVIKIRKGVFETNSSSVHSICITKSSDGLVFPKELLFKPGTFGWEPETLSRPEEKASYLYQAILSVKDKDERNHLLNIIWYKLYECGVMADFETPKKDKYGFPQDYIDHACELNDWIDWLFADTDRILRFLFSDKSFVKTGNDNDPVYPDIRVGYDHDEYWKYN